MDDNHPLLRLIMQIAQVPIEIARLIYEQVLQARLLKRGHLRLPFNAVFPTYTPGWLSPWTYDPHRHWAELMGTVDNWVPNDFSDLKFKYIDPITVEEQNYVRSMKRKRDWWRGILRNTFYETLTGGDMFAYIERQARLMRRRPDGY